MTLVARARVPLSRASPILWSVFPLYNLLLLRACCSLYILCAILQTPLSSPPLLTSIHTVHYAQSNTHSGVDKGKPSPGPAMLSDNILSNASVTDLIKVRNRLFKSFTHADIVLLQNHKVVHFVIMLQNSIEDM